MDDWREALAGLLGELTGLVKDGRELVQAQLAAEQEEAAERRRRAEAAGVRGVSGRPGS